MWKKDVAEKTLKMDHDTKAKAEDDPAGWARYGVMISSIGGCPARLCRTSSVQ